jgi:hypothetical protein
MSRMCTLIHAGWTAARSLARSGRRTAALRQAERLLARPDVPDPVAADAHRLAAEVLIEGSRYKAARRHLRAAAELQQGHSRTYYLAGLAFEQDPEGDDWRAAVRFRKASQLEPGNPTYRAAFGRAAVRCDRIRTGIRELLAAAEMTTAEVGVIRIVVDGLREAGRIEMARRVLLKARFRFPDSTELRGLWDRIRFETARLKQRSERRTQDARTATDGDPALLPFARLHDSIQTPGAGMVRRRDAGSLPRPHLARLRVTSTDR